MSKTKRNHDILFTGGLGDIVAITAFMSPRFRKTIRRIYWAALRGNWLRPTFDRFPEFEGVDHVMLLTDFPNGPYFEAVQVKQAALHLLTGVEDWSIRRIFPRIHSGELTYHNCPFIENRLADIGHLELPDRYYTIQGSTPLNPSDERGNRDLLPMEWSRIRTRLHQTDLHGVVLDVPGEKLPDDDRLVDRRGLTLEQGMEIIKDPRCVGYLGIDSWLAALACHRFPDPKPEQLVIRSRNRHYTDNLRAYCAPHDNPTFVHALVP